METYNEESQSVPMQENANMEEMLTQIVELLLQGVSPEELLNQGIPKELILQAIEMINSQQQQPTEQPQQGLSAIGIR